ncbi:chorismate-binding protein [filamentous cyanobacterium LEGE 11480]|uniref:Anthranilate synthase component 1 n=1 Tax=Romeriopsis navalis LEGE 11480 TaxID=2777977 RepID=A0A928VNT0_9CYAN|nr:chorismate-binding protein [Romeriopsis navalis]MBE9031926.1 chorismate-binding protein [Romeriopsis navalis LEGE 11480]
MSQPAAERKLHWRSLPLNHRTGSEIFTALFLQDDTATLLESPYPASPDYPQLSRYSICAGHPRVMESVVQQWTPNVGEVLPMLKMLHQRSTPDLSNAPVDLPFVGGWLGWLGYDLAWEIEKLPLINADPLPFPVAFWYEPECFTVLDHQEQVLWLAAGDEEKLDELGDRLDAEIRSPLAPLEKGGIGVKVPLSKGDLGGSPTEGQTDLLKPDRVQLSIDYQTQQFDYETAILKAKQHITAGEVFQSNLSLRFTTQTQADSWSIYQALQAINPSPFASYWKTPFGDMVSCSPERLVEGHWEGDKFRVSTRPIAGTRRRGQTAEQDAALAEELRSNDKEQAEHIMLVDLERNDLGRVSEWGSVQVDELLVIEHYSHVMHLVSNVIGTLKPEHDSVDLIRAMFPGGTITGCPKVRCMEIIEALESVRRSLFYGSCGYLDVRGNLDLNILIRTLLYARDLEAEGATVWGQVGAGIVADSDPEREWFESLQKAQAQLQALRMVN